jgi:hypothetical protein
MRDQSYSPLPIVRAFTHRSRLGLSVAPPFGLECLTEPCRLRRSLRLHPDPVPRAIAWRRPHRQSRSRGQRPVIQPPRRQVRYSETRRAEESSFYADVAIIGRVVRRNLVHPVTSNGCRCRCTAHHADGGCESNGEKRQLACKSARGGHVGSDDTRHRRGSSNARCYCHGSSARRRRR